MRVFENHKLLISDHVLELHRENNQPVPDRDRYRERERENDDHARISARTSTSLAAMFIGSPLKATSIRPRHGPGHAAGPAS